MPVGEARGAASTAFARVPRAFAAEGVAAAVPPSSPQGCAFPVSFAFPIVASPSPAALPLPAVESRTTPFPADKAHSVHGQEGPRPGGASGTPVGPIVRIGTGAAAARQLECRRHQGRR